MTSAVCTRPPQLAAVALALADTEEALRELRATVNALTHPDSKLRKLLAVVEAKHRAATRALERAQEKTS